MDFAILGPLRVAGDDGPVELRAPKQRALLAMLLLAHRDVAVSAERLTDVLWGEDPPVTAPKALQVYVSQLRRALGPGQPIVTRGAGYAVELAPGQLDLERFETLTESARGARADGRLADAATALREGLALFRGTPLAGTPLLGPGAAEADRLAALRLAALEERLDLDLALGEHAAVAGELEALAAEHPYRERLHAQLMLALYRAGRQADALDAFRRVRHALVEELGLDPGRELKRLEGAILAQDPALDLAPAAAVAPPPRTAEPARPPLTATPLLGRAEDVATATALLADPEVRLLTLTGPGGIGKTRLARELAARLESSFEDGARFVTLAAVGDPERVVPAVAQALGALESEAQSPHEALVALLAGRELLLVLDNLEQVLAAAPELAGLLAAAPRLKLLVTSRAALRVSGEYELAIAPLAPAPAADLFLRRARALNPRMAVGEGEQAGVARICERLDGLPLAIELAAARSKVLTPAAILERLERRLDLLSAGPRDAPARQQTLRATIDWSYDLLDPAAQRLYARLGVFVGGWTLEAAEAVCGPDALDGLETLVGQSLVTAAEGRFGMLQTVRDYARERLEQDGGLDATRRAHAQVFAAFADEAGRGVHSADAGVWLDRLHADRENVREAIGFAVGSGDAETALTLCAGVWRYWVVRGNLTEGRALAEAVLGSGEGSPRARFGALDGAGVLAGEQGDFAASRAHFEASLAIAQELDAPESLARALANLGNLAVYEDDVDEAIRLYEASTALWRSLGHDRGLSISTQNLGLAHSGAGNHEQAAALLEESVVVARCAGDPAHLASALRSLARARLMGGCDPAEVLPIVQESLAFSRELADRPGLAECLETLAAVVEPQLGAELIGAAEAARAAAGAARQPDEERWASEVKARLRETLGADRFAAAAREGARFDLLEAVARAVAV